MILLQERRNIAAHRGTIIDAGEIRALREQSIFVLASIDSLCPPSIRQRRQLSSSDKTKISA
jgi:hypothetical protein